MREDTKRMVAIMADVLGITSEEILSKDRTSPRPFCRYLIAQELINKGLSTSKAGREIGIDHSTVVYGLKMLKAISKANGYAYELQIQKNFLTACAFFDIL